MSVLRVNSLFESCTVAFMAGVVGKEGFFCLEPSNRRALIDGLLGVDMAELRSTFLWHNGLLHFLVLHGHQSTYDLRSIDMSIDLNLMLGIFIS